MKLKTNTENKILKSEELVQLRHVKGESVFITDPEGSNIEIKKTDDGTTFLCTQDEKGNSLAIEERINGTKVYHVSSDSTGLPSSHEVRADKTEIVYFYDTHGKLEHFVELKACGDRISTVLCDDGTIYSIEQKLIGGIIFQAWMRGEEPKDGMIWLHPTGEVSTYGDKSIILNLYNKFTRFLDGVSIG